MTNPLENRVSSSRSKAIIGIEYEHFLALVDLAEQKHLEKQAKIEKTKFVWSPLVVDVDQICHQNKEYVCVWYIWDKSQYLKY